MNFIHTTKKYIAVLWGITIMGTTYSCSDWLDQETYSDIADSQIPDSDEGANMWVTGAYNELTYMFTWSNYFRVMDFDNDFASGPTWAFSETGVGNFQGSGGHVNSLWEQTYLLIDRTNEAIAHVEKMSNVSEREKKDALGELYFLQAYGYFILVRAFGEIPIHTVSINQGGNPHQPRQSLSAVYSHIITLLSNAKDMMYKNTESGFKEGRACAGAAATLLAKVYATIGSASMSAGETVSVKGGIPFTFDDQSKMVLTNPTEQNFEKEQVNGYDCFDSQEYYQKALALAREIVNDKKYGIHELIPYNQLWKKSGRDSREQLFSLQTISGDEVFGATYSSQYCGQIVSGYVLGSSMIFGFRSHWYKLFETNDLRVKDGVIHHWIRSFDGNPSVIGNYYPDGEEWKNMANNLGDGREYTYEIGEWSMAYINKYADVTDASFGRTDAPYPLLRYADAVLILAEASNEVNGPQEEAINALKSVRTRSGASVDDLTFRDKEALRSFILEERAREFVAESDRRWDLIRWGIYLQTMNAIGGVDENNISKSRERKHLLYPIPLEEINANKEINENNPGWN